MTKLIPKNSEIIDGKYTTNFAVIDGETGEELRVSKVTPELKTLLDSIEIDVTDYIKWREMKRKNKNLTKLVNTFNLILD